MRIQCIGMSCAKKKNARNGSHDSGSRESLVARGSGSVKDAVDKQWVLLCRRINARRCFLDAGVNICRPYQKVNAQVVED